MSANRYQTTSCNRSTEVIAIFFSLLLIYGCGEEKPTLFNKLSPEQTGITFNNKIHSSDTLSVEDYSFLYNGAGVAAGDINNNGLPDLFFSGNMESSRLYLNQGEMQFEDITESAGLETERWITGVSMVDINNNGYLDIYLSVGGPADTSPEQQSNLLYLNNGDETFTEAASDFNIDYTGFTTHAVFFDYNRNGYLDLFLLNNSPEEFGRSQSGRDPPGFTSDVKTSYDKLYRNNGDGTYTDVSQEAGILEKVGFGLGVVVTDLNANGWPDIYVSNDITPNDVLYINNKDGTFTDKAAELLKHTSYAGMGIDIADFTNNGWADILQTDMVPEDINDRKLIAGATTYSNFTQLRRRGYFPHYNVNTLQMNNGITEDGDPVYSEVARMAGVSYTDWSWTALFGDYTNNGWKDALVTNGYPKAINDFDYFSDMHNARNREEQLEILDEIHSYHVPNYIFRNEGEIIFSKKTEEWGLNHPGYSYGAAQVDLNNNGRLDLVINNIDDYASIYENAGLPEKEAAHFLQVRLEGEYPNLRGIGAELVLSAGGQQQYLYHNPFRGYKSTMDDRAHFGLGQAAHIDSLEIYWPDGQYQLLTDVQADQLITVDKQEATQQKERTPFVYNTDTIFKPAGDEFGLHHEHQPRSSGVDYSVQPLLANKVSKQDPPLATGDVTGNGYDDLFIGGGAGEAATLYLQQQDGSFEQFNDAQPWLPDREMEDWGAVLFDANGNGLLDIYVASGGYRHSPISSLMQDRLYINQGNGRFSKDEQALPGMLTSTAAVTAGDFTGNGQKDLFVGGRVSPRDYPYPTRSYLLQNDGGRFTDVTEKHAPELVEPGMITDAKWVDITNNGNPDLVTVGKWMTPRFFENDGNNLNDITESMDLPPLRGWWYSLESADLTNNGYEDLVIGNLGLNHTFTTSEEQPFGLYAGDFTGNRTTELIYTRKIEGTEYPFYGLAKLGRIMENIRMRFDSFESFARATLRDVLNSSELNEATQFRADTFAGITMINNGDGTFEVEKLPEPAQISPIKGILVNDFDRDGHTDVLIAGNLYHTEPNIPRADAGNGLWLKNDGTGNLTPVSPHESGFLAPLDVKDLALLRLADGRDAVIVANNNDELQVYTIDLPDDEPEISHITE